MNPGQTSATSTSSTSAVASSLNKRKFNDDWSDNESSESFEDTEETIEEQAKLYRVFLDTREGMTLFLAACEFSSVIVVNEFLAKDLSLIDSVSGVGMTPLHYACYGGNEGVAKLLYNLKSELLKQPTKSGDSCLRYAQINFRYNETIESWVGSCNPQFFEELEANNAKNPKIQGYLELVFRMEDACKIFNFGKNHEVVRMLQEINLTTQLADMVDAAKKFLTSASQLYLKSEPQFSGDSADIKVLQEAFKKLMEKVGTNFENQRLKDYLQSI